MTHHIDCDHVLTPDGWRRDVRLELNEAGMIDAVRAGAAGSERRLRVVIPGMPNVHSHGFQRLIAGLTGRPVRHGDSFWTWRRSMYEAARWLNPERLRDCLAGVYLDMLRGGYTACAEFHYLHHRPDGSPYEERAAMSLAVFEAAEDIGMSLTLLPVLYERAGFGAETTEPDQAMFHNDVDRYAALVSDCRRAAVDRGHVVGMAPHSLRAARPSSLRHIADSAPAEMPIHIHVAEQPREVKECREHLGAAPVRWLLEHVGLNGRWCLVHATHATPSELTDAAAAGAVAGLCPTTEADLGDGLFSAESWLDSGGRFGIGSDSNLRLDVGEELRLLEFGQRLRLGRRNVLADAERSCGRRLYEDAASGGGVALGRPVGRIASGYRADLVELDTAHPLLDGLQGDAWLDSYVFAGGADLIRSVYVAGRARLRGGRHEKQERVETAFRDILRQAREGM